MGWWAPTAGTKTLACTVSSPLYCSFMEIVGPMVLLLTSTAVLFVLCLVAWRLLR